MNGNHLEQPPLVTKRGNIFLFTKNKPGRFEDFLTEANALWLKKHEQTIRIGKFDIQYDTLI